MKYLFFILFFSSSLLAQDSIINIEGLTFNCEGCAQIDDNYCNVPWGDKNVNVECSSVVNVLLQKVKKEDLYPMTDELISYLSRSDIDSFFKKLAYKLVLDRKVDSRKLDGIISLLINRDYNIISYLIDSKFEYFNQMLWERRKLLSRDDYFKLLDLKGGLEALEIDLTVVDLNQDITLLSSYLEHSKDNNSSKIVTFLKNCRDNLKCEIDFKLDTVLDSYLSRVQNTVVSNYVLSKEEKNINDLDLLITTSYKNFRTPETHLALISIMEALNLKNKWEELSLSQKDFLGFMANKDNRIAKLIYKEDKKSLDLGSWIFFLVSSILLSAIFFLLYSGKKVKLVKNENRELKKELNELIKIWSFFGLSKGANITDLKKSYRQMAREKHPDKSGSAEDFMLVNKYYKRALELMENE